MRVKTDSEVEQLVLRELSLSEKACSREVCVLARDGVVRLGGSAQSYQDKLSIEEATRRAAGVVAVVNDMKVMSTGPRSERVFGNVPFTGSPSKRVSVQSVAIQ